MTLVLAMWGGLMVAISPAAQTVQGEAAQSICAPNVGTSTKVSIVGRLAPTRHGLLLTDPSCPDRAMRVVQPVEGAAGTILTDILRTRDQYESGPVLVVGRVASSASGRQMTVESIVQLAVPVSGSSVPENPKEDTLLPDKGLE